MIKNGRKYYWILLRDSEIVGSFAWIGAGMGYVNACLGNKDLDWERSDGGRMCCWWSVDGVWELIPTQHMPRCGEDDEPE
ncbi:hypothetical protein [Nocardia jiangxiensis]|uniref:hypothetical protein n=1 Tax=Nocardia jiangxiensis TaxID=282685 RepID=UPI0002EA0DEA|nr:hypothetical protein [Nocardia jiangxiensis]